MKHLDLFSGIGGFALATDRVWPNVEHMFCEIDPFCQEVLKKHWPSAVIYGDIRTLTNPQYYGFNGTKDAKSYRARTNRHPQRSNQLRQSERSNTVWPEIDLLTGGFPCQPFSQAGRKRGTEDDRYLWPEMLRVVKEFKPTWIIGENVAGIVNMVLEQVCLDLEAEGYEVWPLIIPAVALNAPHRRDRVWIIAYDGRKRRGEGSNQGLRSKSQKSERAYSGFGGWERNWPEVAAELCRVDDGLPKRLDRNPRLKALGNAIVPQVAEQIMKAIYK